MITNQQLAQMCLGLTGLQIARINARLTGTLFVQQEFKRYESPEGAQATMEHSNEDGGYFTTEYITVFPCSPE